MKIAICGTRGIPACYGGFETFAEELAIRLVSKGHSVRVYGRKHVIKHDSNNYRGVEIKLLPAPRHKYLETPLHTLLSFFHLITNRVDVILVCNAANSPFVWLPRLAGMPVAVNVDGIERKRAKWNALGKLWYRFGEVTSVWFASKIIADARVIEDYYVEKYKASSTVIAYGYRKDAEELAELRCSGADAINESLYQLKPALFNELGVKPDAYWLYVSRLEPENNAHLVIQAFNQLPQEAREKCPLLIVGDAPYADAYIQGLKEQASSEVRFAGYRFGEDYRVLQLAARAYIQASEVGGTHPALVEAMGYGNCVIANNTPENKEVLADSGLLYKKNNPADLASILLKLADDMDQVRSWRIKARRRALTVYNWDIVVENYEQLFAELIG